jgi:hypothetical protein
MGWVLVLVACILPLAAAQAAPTELAAPEDMACASGPRAGQWLQVKQRFRKLFEGANGPFKQVGTDTLVAAVKTSLDELEVVRGLSTDADAVNECGFGKLFIQLLSLVAVDDPASLAQYFQDHTAVASPVLTMLLDIPWVSMAQSGWPFFAILAQINFQKVKLLSPMLNVAAVDGLANEAVSAYFDLMTGPTSADMHAMATASQMYLRNPPPDSLYGTLTAMATQAAISMDIQERLKDIQALQEGFRQTILTPSELDIALTIRWPLWGFLHVSVDVFADA